MLSWEHVLRRVLVLALGSSALWGSALWGQGAVPRPAPELKIIQGSGAVTTLSSYRGRVVLLAFISTQCVHCQKASAVFEQLGREYAGKLQVAEVAFDEGADGLAFKKRFGLTFPVGISSSDAAHAFLGIPAGARLGTPQVVAIDRTGVIRAQSERLGTPMLQTAEYLRSLLNAILGSRVQ